MNFYITKFLSRHPWTDIAARWAREKYNERKRQNSNLACTNDNNDNKDLHLLIVLYILIMSLRDLQIYYYPGYKIKGRLINAGLGFKSSTMSLLAK